MLNVSSLCARHADGNFALKNITFNLKKGEILAVLGANGAGKSTLIKALTALLPIEQGEVDLLGKPLKDYSRKELARKMAYVPQFSYSWSDYNVEELVLLGRYAHRERFQKISQKDRDAVELALMETGTEHLRKRQIMSLSGGERQRVTIAKCLAQEPSLLMMDEPINHLDLMQQVEVASLIHDLANHGKRSILIVLHDLSLAYHLADRILLLKDGEQVGLGPSKDVLTEESIKEAFGIDTIFLQVPEQDRVIIETNLTF